MVEQDEQVGQCFIDVMGAYTIQRIRRIHQYGSSCVENKESTTTYVITYKFVADKVLDSHYNVTTSTC